MKSHLVATEKLLRIVYHLLGSSILVPDEEDSHGQSEVALVSSKNVDHGKKWKRTSKKRQKSKMKRKRTVEWIKG